MLEKIVEQSLISHIKKLGGIAFKFVSPGLRGVPDRLCVLPIPQRYREVVNRYVKFVEVKKPGEKPDKHQLRRHVELNELGYDVQILDERIKRNG
jgi:hypothetical protein